MRLTHSAAPTPNRATRTASYTGFKLLRSTELWLLEGKHSILTRGDVICAINTRPSACPVHYGGLPTRRAGRDQSIALLDLDPFSPVTVHLSDGCPGISSSVPQRLGSDARCHRSRARLAIAGIWNESVDKSNRTLTRGCTAEPQNVVELRPFVIAL